MPLWEVSGDGKGVCVGIGSNMAVQVWEVG